MSKRLQAPRALASAFACVAGSTAGVRPSGGTVTGGAADEAVVGGADTRLEAPDDAHPVVAAPSATASSAVHRTCRSCPELDGVQTLGQRATARKASGGGAYQLGV